MPKVSIITASFRSAATIGDTLRSINVQTYPDIEHIVVDGASKDDTMAIVQREGKRVALAVSEPDKGIYDAYNKGLKLVTGDIIGFLNSDDFYCTPDAIARIAKAFEDPAIDACYGDLVYVDQIDTNKIVRHWKSRPYRESLFRKAFVPAHPTLFLRKSFYDRVGGYDLDYRLAADYEFMLRIFNDYHARSVYIPEILVKMRVGGATGASMDAIVKQNREIMRALAKHNVKVWAPGFMLRKTVNRLAQRVRAKFIHLEPSRAAS